MNLALIRSRWNSVYSCPALESFCKSEVPSVTHKICLLWAHFTKGFYHICSNTKPIGFILFGSCWNFLYGCLALSSFSKSELPSVTVKLCLLYWLFAGYLQLINSWVDSFALSHKYAKKIKISNENHALRIEKVPPQVAPPCRSLFIIIIIIIIDSCHRLDLQLSTTAEEPKKGRSWLWLGAVETSSKLWVAVSLEKDEGQRRLMCR